MNFLGVLVRSKEAEMWIVATLGMKSSKSLNKTCGPLCLHSFKHEKNLAGCILRIHYGLQAEVLLVEESERNKIRKTRLSKGASLEMATIL